MASATISDFLSAKGMQQLLHLAVPATAADYAALSVFSLAGVGWLSRGTFWDQKDPNERLFFERPQLKNGAAEDAASRKETRNIARKLDETGKNIVVFWGSQSGTSEGFANRLGRELHGRFGQETLTADLSDYDPESITMISDSKLAIFILSTYGEGDPSDNTTEFWEWITKVQDTPLKSLRYAAFGLGNSNYKFFNRVVDVVTESLDKLGAASLMPVRKANDAEGATAEDFMAWKDELFNVLAERLGMTEREATYLPTMAVEPDESLEPIDLHHGEPSIAAMGSNPIRALPITHTRELFNSSKRHCLHLDLDLTEHPQLTYKTGDHITLWPGNFDSEIESLLDVLDLSHRRHVPISIKSLDPTVKVPVPTPTSYKALLRYYLEIGAPVNRDSILGLAQFAPTTDAKAHLLQLGKDREAYAELVGRTHLTFARLLRTVCPTQKWSSIPLSFLIETLPPIQPRYYSISSSSTVSPRTLSITVAVSQDPVSQGSEQVIHGITSNYLLALSNRANLNQPHPQGLTYSLDGPNNALEGGRIFAQIRKSKFRLPAQSACPLIMVAAGTGLAPFRGFLDERRRLLQIGKPVGEMVLFFGCRHPNEDYIYRAELEEMERAFDGKLRIVTAFSRMQDEPRFYVQDRITQFGGEIARLLDDDATLYICGRAAMARDVEKAVEGIMKVEKGWAAEELDGWTKAVKRRRKWQEDVWG